ncbi:cupin domain-containing protein [Vibrio sp. NTOU-M3]|uniref:cupin domain-containing protein n=1 Tax=Vibrio sp. NTOU-M3 TaxID=3234954 RepID=UPI00349F1BBF
MNLFKQLPGDLSSEVFEDLIKTEHVRVERIISFGHVTAEDEWYDQPEHEWVVVLEGAGRIRYADGSEIELNIGDHINIPAHTKHQVSWTKPDAITIWLAVFY